MPSLRYLNTVLTVIALLLTLQLWTLWTSPAATVPGVDADLSFDVARQAHAQPTVQPAEQRHQMIRLLRSIDEKLGAKHKTLTSGDVRVQIDNLDALRPEPRPRDNDDNADE